MNHPDPIDMQISANLVCIKPPNKTNPNPKKRTNKELQEENDALREELKRTRPVAVSPEDFRPVNEMLRDPVTLGLMVRPMVLRPCGHALGEGVMKELRKTNKGCPECRKPIIDGTLSVTLNTMAREAEKHLSYEEWWPIVNGRLSEIVEDRPSQVLDGASLTKAREAVRDLANSPPCTHTSTDGYRIFAQTIDHLLHSIQIMQGLPIEENEKMADFLNHAMNSLTRSQEDRSRRGSHDCSQVGNAHVLDSSPRARDHAENGQRIVADSDESSDDEDNGEGTDEDTGQGN